MVLSFASKSPSFPNSFAVTRKFIRLVEQFPVLHGRHSKRTADVCWTKLEQIMDIPKKALMSKWRRLRDTYRRELKSEFAVSPGQHYITNWPFFEQLHFLRPIILRSFNGNGAIPGSGVKINLPPNRFQENRSILKVPAAPGNGSNQSKPATPPTNTAAREAPGQQSVPLPEPLNSIDSKSIGSDYELLMTHIYPYLQAMPAASKMALYAKMQQLVYWEYMFESKRQAQCRRPNDWMGDTALDDEFIAMMQLDDPLLGHAGAF